MITDSISLLVGWLLDRCLGDPARLPHPVVAFGKAISACERALNRGAHRRLKGGAMAVVLILLAYVVTAALLSAAACAGQQLGLHSAWIESACSAVLIFYCLAGTTLVREVRDVFKALERSLADGRRQVGRIVGRDTARLSAQQVRQAALETLAENLSDGVVAPLFWLALLGVPGMMAYKMVNTLDSMIGYRTERYRRFGTVAARIDDTANYVPARLTALLMLLVAVPWKEGRLTFLFRYAHCHLSPNSGWPEAALATLLDCRFGGAHDYFGEAVDKPFIGHNPRTLTTHDMQTAVAINRRVEYLCVVFLLAAQLIAPLLLHS